MKVTRLLLGAALAVALACPLLAQQAPAPTGFYRAACVKIKPGMGHQFHDWALGDLHKWAQSRANSGAIAAMYLLTADIPQGQSARCDVLIVSMYSGVPDPPMSREDFIAAFKQAGVSGTAQEFLDKRDSMTTLVSNDMFRNVTRVGTAKKGDYFIINDMKVANMDDYIAYEKKVWAPFAEELAKGGSRTGWSLNERVFPSGSDTTYQAVTVDVIPSWNEIFQPSGDFVATFKKTHPDMELGTTFEQYEKLRTIVSTQVYHVMDLVTPAK